MAQKTAELHKALYDAAVQEGLSKSDLPELWLVGYTELKKGGIFIPYKETLMKEYEGSDAWGKVFVFQHFSMNRFLVDLKQFCKENPDLKLTSAISKTGTIHKKEIFQ